LALIADFLIANQEQFEASNLEFEDPQGMPLARLALAVARSALGAMLAARTNARLNGCWSLPVLVAPQKRMLI
jgi:hypothetical protein